MGFIPKAAAIDAEDCVFPSPYGAWVLSKNGLTIKPHLKVSVPLRGMGFIGYDSYFGYDYESFRPLTGHGFYQRRYIIMLKVTQFPSPYGAWVLSPARRSTTRSEECFRPLTGHGFYRKIRELTANLF